MDLYSLAAGRVDVAQGAHGTRADGGGNSGSGTATDAQGAVAGKAGDERSGAPSKCKFDFVFNTSWFLWSLRLS